MKKLAIVIFLLFIAGSGVAGEVEQNFQEIYYIRDFMGIRHYTGDFYYGNLKSVMVTPGITVGLQRLLSSNFALGAEFGFNYHHYLLRTSNVAHMTEDNYFKNSVRIESKNFHIGPALDYFFDYPGFKVMVGVFTGFDLEVAKYSEPSFLATGENAVTYLYKHSFLINARSGLSFPLGKSLAFFFSYSLGLMYSSVEGSPVGNASDAIILYSAGLKSASGVTMVNSISFGIQYYR